MNPSLTMTVGLIFLAIVATVLVMKWRSTHAAPPEIAKIEAAMVEDGWKLLSKTVAAVADASGKKTALANATADLAEHFDNVRKLKAAVSQLPEA